MKKHIFMKFMLYLCFIHAFYSAAYASECLRRYAACRRLLYQFRGFAIAVHETVRQARPSSERGEWMGAVC